MGTRGLKLHSPVGNEPMLYPWPNSSSGFCDKHDHASDIVETMRWVCEDLPELKVKLERIFHEPIPQDFESLKKLCDDYNTCIDSILVLARCNIKSERKVYERPSSGLLRHIVQLIYNQSVEDPEKLNQYEPFSPEVYGETSFDLIEQMVNQVEINEDDVFIDLGSGVGQVVLQMAASSICKICYGIERADVPSSYSELMDENFQKWMKWYGKHYSQYKIIKGDFLNPEYKDKVVSATIVFVNNFAFGPAVDHKLKEIFADLKDGTKIVSSKSFCPLNFRITDRNLSDIGTIMHVSEMSPLKGSVSWTGKPVSYYLHVIDRTKLERYFQRLKNPKPKEDEHCVARNRVKRDLNKHLGSYHDSSSNDSKENNGEFVVGPTTRRAWSDWCNRSRSGKESQSETEEDKSKYRKGGKRLGRPRKHRKRKTKKRFHINGLDLLHSETVLSTSPQVMRNQPPAPGCVEQVLPIVPISKCTHDKENNQGAPLQEPSDQQDGLKAGIRQLLQSYETQLLEIVKEMSTNHYRVNLEKQIQQEKDFNSHLNMRISQLDKQIKLLVEDSVTLLKTRMMELGIQANTPADLLSRAKEIVLRHKELQSRASSLQTCVNELEMQKKKYSSQRQHEILEQYGHKNHSLKIGTEGDLSSMAHELVLQEISLALMKRKKLHNQVTKLENELVSLEKSESDKLGKNGDAFVNFDNRLKIPSQPVTFKAEDFRGYLKGGGPIGSNNGKSNSGKPNKSKFLQNRMSHNSLLTPSEVNSVKQNLTNPNIKYNSKSCVPSTPLMQTSSHLKPSKLKQEPPRVTDFEDRLKSIITSVLNEDKSPPMSTNLSVPGVCHSSFHFPVANNSTKLYNSGVDTPKLSASPPQPDYTQVSPAKLALRRHLSQERISQDPIQPLTKAPVPKQTVGDLLQNEVERTLEISSQSIINAAIDMSYHGDDKAAQSSLKKGSITSRIDKIVEESVRKAIASVSVGPVHSCGQRETDVTPAVNENPYSPISRPTSPDNLSNTQSDGALQFFPKINQKLNLPEVNPALPLQFLQSGAAAKPPAVMCPASHSTTQFTVGNKYLNGSVLKHGESSTNPGFERPRLNPCLASQLFIKTEQIEYPPVEGLAAFLQDRIQGHMENRIRPLNMRCLNSPQLKIAFKSNDSSITIKREVDSDIEGTASADKCLDGENPIMERDFCKAHVTSDKVKISDQSTCSNTNCSEPLRIIPPISPSSDKSPPITPGLDLESPGDKPVEGDVSFKGQGRVDTSNKKWQDRISSGFDKLVAFASTEIDKREKVADDGDKNSLFSKCKGTLEEGLFSRFMNNNEKDPCKPSQPDGASDESRVHRHKRPHSESRYDFKLPKIEPSTSPQHIHNYMTKSVNPSLCSDKIPDSLMRDCVDRGYPVHPDNMLYDLHFKKKYLTKDKEEATSLQFDHGRFRPKGKDWEWNQNREAQKSKERTAD